MAQQPAPKPAPNSITWPQRFRRAHGRAPRVLHICNIANYAWVNASLMRRFGVDAVVLDPDYFHVGSTPEWLEAEISGDYGDPAYPRWSAVKVKGFERPEWFINGPTPFVFRELAAREEGRGAARSFYAGLSRLYRRGLEARKGEISTMRRILESGGPASRVLKSLARAITLRSVGSQPVMPAATTATSDADIAASVFPPRVPRAVIESALAGFDAIIGYTLGARYAAALGLPRFVSLELGTLRGLPFEDSDLGRQCAWLYRMSPEVFVTNLDCLEPALKLGIPQSAVTAIPHPFNVERAIAYAAAAPVTKGDGVPYFFCPARHHWKHGNASWLKGNHILIRGAAEAARNGAHFELVMVDWGLEVDFSKQLINECGISDRVRWIEPANRLALWPIMAGAAGILDQFAGIGFGGVGLESMALGKRVVLRIAGVDWQPYFTAPPPIIHAETPAEVAHSIASILDDPDDRRGIGHAGQEWMVKEHGVDRQLALQFAALERLVERHGPA